MPMTSRVDVERSGLPGATPHFRAVCEGCWAGLWQWDPDPEVAETLAVEDGTDHQIAVHGDDAIEVPLW